MPATRRPARPRRAGRGGDEHARLLRVRRSLRRALVSWSLASIATGVLLAVSGGERPARAWRAGLARQLVGWGGVDLAIVAAGAVADARPVTDAAQATRSLRRLLWLNAALDVGYVAAGTALLARRELRGRRVDGDGLGVVVQGAFLLALDARHAHELRPVRH